MPPPEWHTVRNVQGCTKRTSPVCVKLVEKLRLVYPRQAGEHNFSALSHTTWEVSFSAALYVWELVQGWAKKWAPGFENFAPPVAYHFCLNLPGKSSQPGGHFSAQPCTQFTEGETFSINSIMSLLTYNQHLEDVLINLLVSTL